jgi:cold shock CspA family protein
MTKPMTAGVVIFFDVDRGIGFVRVDGHPDVFVSYRDVIDRFELPLHPGDCVQFRMAATTRGLRAYGVRRQRPADEGEIPTAGQEVR